MRRHRVRIPLRGPWALLVGVVCLGVAMYQYLTSSALAEDGVATLATVVEVDERSKRRSNGGRRWTYALTLEFEGPRGAIVRERTGYSSSYRGHRAGDEVEILYNPADPSEFALNSWRDLWMMPLVLAGIGAVACGRFLFGSARRA